VEAGAGHDKRVGKMISPLTKVLAIAVALLVLTLGAAGWLLKHQIEETAVAQKRATDAEDSLIAVSKNLKVWNETLAAVDEKLGKLRGNAWQQRQALDKILGEVANENPDWARARLPADYVAGLCAAGLVSAASHAELCADPAAPAR